MFSLELSTSNITGSVEGSLPVIIYFRNSSTKEAQYISQSGGPNCRAYQVDDHGVEADTKDRATLLRSPWMDLMGSIRGGTFQPNRVYGEQLDVSKMLAFPGAGTWSIKFSITVGVGKEEIIVESAIANVVIYPTPMHNWTVVGRK